MTTKACTASAEKALKWGMQIATAFAAVAPPPTVLGCQWPPSAIGIVNVCGDCSQASTSAVHPWSTQPPSTNRCLSVSSRWAHFSGIAETSCAGLSRNLVSCRISLDASVAMAKQRSDSAVKVRANCCAEHAAGSLWSRRCLAICSANMMKESRFRRSLSAGLKCDSNLCAANLRFRIGFRRAWPWQAAMTLDWQAQTHRPLLHHMCWKVSLWLPRLSWWTAPVHRARCLSCRLSSEMISSCRGRAATSHWWSYLPWTASSRSCQKKMIATSLWCVDVHMYLLLAYSRTHGLGCFKQQVVT